MGHKITRFILRLLHFHVLCRKYRIGCILKETYVMDRFEKIDRVWLDVHPKVGVIGSPTTGTDHLDMKEISKRGIICKTLKKEKRFLRTITSTAEHTLGLIISLMRNYKKAFRSPLEERDVYMGRKLMGKTAGIIGHKGRIGKMISKMLKASGMKIIGYDTRSWIKGNLTKLLTESDVVSIHIHLQGNEGFFTKSMFSLMKKTAYIVNTSRAEIFEKGALLDALKKGKIAGAALDFIGDKDLELYAKTHDNLILTNHMGGLTWEDRKSTQEFISKKCNQC